MTPSAAVVRMEDKSAMIQPIKVETISERVNKIYDAISKRAYEIFEGNGKKFGYDLNDWFKAEMELLHPIPIEISDSGEALQLKAEVPGFNEKEIQISIEPRRITLTGNRETKREESKGKTVYTEFSSDQILRAIDLPEAVDAEKASATLKDGVLRLTMPKATQAKTIELKRKGA
jgi:HSP20 family molecular chaperone IbpA